MCIDWTKPIEYFYSTVGYSSPAILLSRDGIGKGHNLVKAIGATGCEDIFYVTDEGRILDYTSSFIRNTKIKYVRYVNLYKDGNASKVYASEYEAQKDANYNTLANRPVETRKIEWEAPNS